MFSLIIYILTAAVGFMMGYLYKRSFTNAQFFNPDPKKALRLFITMFSLATVLTFTLSWVTTHLLSESTIAEEGNIKYQNTHSVMIFVLNFFFFALVVLANVYSQALKKVAWVPYLLTIGFYAVFILKDTYYVSNYYVTWQQAMHLTVGDISDLIQKAWTKVALGLAVTVFNLGMIWWGFRK
ncbi:MAG: hypothetical protein U0T75_14190 [Chitinophagales bacterium]